MVQFNSGGFQFSSYPHYIAITYIYIYIIEMPDDMMIYWLGWWFGTMEYL